MREFLQQADFAHALPMRILPDGALHGPIGDLALPHYHHFILSGINFVPLSCAAHTLDMYRRLPHGWRTTPQGIWTDLYMWQQFLEQPQCRAISSLRPTVLHFPSSERKSWTLEERVTELSAWSSKYTKAQWRREFTEAVLELVVRERALFYAQVDSFNRRSAGLTQLRQQLEDSLKERDRLMQENTQLNDEFARMYKTATWRLRHRLMQVPIASTLLRKIMRLLADSLPS